MLTARIAHLESLLARAHRPGGVYPVLSLASRNVSAEERTAMSSRIEASPVAEVWRVRNDGSRSGADRAFPLSTLDPAHAHVHFMVADLFLRDDDA